MPNADFIKKHRLSYTLFSTFDFQKSAAIFGKKIHWDESFHSLNVIYILLYMK